MDEQLTNNQPTSSDDPSSPASNRQSMDVTTPSNFQPPAAATEASSSVQPTATSPSTPMAQLPTEQGLPMQPPAHPTHGHKGDAPVAAIVIAVVVAIALAGVVIFSYLKAKNNDAIKRQDSASSSQTVTEKPQASVADVDSTNAELDSSLKQIDDNKDFAATELSDTTLGL